MKNIIIWFLQEQYKCCLYTYMMSTWCMMCICYNGLRKYRFQCNDSVYKFMFICLMITVPHCHLVYFFINIHHTVIKHFRTVFSFFLSILFLACCTVVNKLYIIEIDDQLLLNYYVIHIPSWHDIVLIDSWLTHQYCLFIERYTFTQLSLMRFM